MKLLIFITLLLVVILGIWYLFGNRMKEKISPPPKGIVWKLLNDSIPKSEEQGIKDATKVLEPQIQDPEHFYIEITNANIASDSAMITGPEMPRSPEYSTTGIFIAVGNKDSSGWHFVTGNDPKFCQFLKKYPLNESDKTYFGGCKEL